MPKKKELVDSLGDPIDRMKVMMEWLTTSQAVDYLAERDQKMTVSGITMAARANRLRAFKMGGQWRIAPESLDGFHKNHNRISRDN